MKRSHTSGSTNVRDSPQHKKAKIMTPVAAQDQQPDGWTRVEKRKQKKAKKTEVKQSTVQPRFLYAISEITRRNRAVGIEDIRDLCLHLAADSPSPNWLRVENSNLVPKVVALLIPGLTHDIVKLPPLPTSATSNANVPISIPLPSTPQIHDGLTTTLPFIAATFSHACPTRAPGDQSRMHSVLSAFCTGPVSAKEKQRRLEQRQASEREHGGSPLQYILTPEQMIENDYPMPSYISDVFEKPAGWVETPQSKDVSEKPKVYAIDCEMCLTEDGKELTRVCIIDFYSGKVLYDQLVKPAKPILDYLTRWSGITAEALNPVTTTLAQVQAHLLRLLSPPAANPFSTSSSAAPASSPTPILLGHSLESDLKALKLCHPYCIDTAVIYHHPRGRPLKPGLAWLTNKWCGREIQTRGEGGHDPEEDARACLELLQKKLEYGPTFGEFKIDYESIFETMARAKGGDGRVRTAVVDHGNPSAMHGKTATSSIGCSSDEEVLQKMLEVIPSHQFIFARFTELADVQGWLTPKASGDESQPRPLPADATPEALSAALESMNAKLKTLHAALPSRTAFILFSGHSDPRQMAALNARKSLFETALRNGKDIGQDERWTSMNGRDLEEAVEKAKRGLLFLGVKS